MTAFNSGRPLIPSTGCEDGGVTIDVRRSGDRFVTRTDGMTTYHSFSYGAHYDPENVGFGPLVALNDEHLPAGTGYDEHRHAATQIVTWVLEGQLHHTDSLGNNGLLQAGTVAVAGTGSGILHSERATAEHPVRFLQMMLRPQQVDADPSYAVDLVPQAAGLREVVGPAAALPVGVAGARFLVGDLDPGRHGLPEAGLVHLFVVSGRCALADRTLGAGDTARLVEETGLDLQVLEHAEVGVWVFG